MTETCHACGEPNARHPAPDGPIWVLVCDACRAASEQTFATHGDADDGASPETWNAWALEAPKPEDAEPADGAQPWWNEVNP